MTIARQINAAEFATRLGFLERCAEEAPAGTYETAKRVASLVGDTMDEIMTSLKAAGLKTDGCDEARTLEGCLYRYILKANPEAGELMAAEAYGVNLDAKSA